MGIFKKPEAKKPDDKYTKVFRQLVQAPKIDKDIANLRRFGKGYVLSNPEEGLFWGNDEKTAIRIYMDEEAATFDRDRLPSSDGWRVFSVAVFYTGKNS